MNDIFPLYKTEMFWNEHCLQKTFIVILREVIILV